MKDEEIFNIRVYIIIIHLGNQWYSEGWIGKIIEDESGYCCGIGIKPEEDRVTRKRYT